VNGSEFQFIPDEKFSPTERAFFLDVLMRSPLPEGVITSDYGIRKSPISGKEHFHGGLDLAAPHGTNVLACKSGVVLQTGFDSELGNFIIINHDSKNQSLYAHLSEILKKTGDFVTSGTVIGKVGSTGASTGPHLHFEIRSGGKKINPRSVIR
jgi:murein DD-endopeptidase MepM/ murein hydrolase activator NlpD